MRSMAQPWPVGGQSIGFESSGDSFSPSLRLWPGHSAQVSWVNSDGATSSSLTPVWNWGSAANRWHELRVSPWSALMGIDCGYDGADSGTNYLDASWFRSPTSLRNVRNLRLARNLYAFVACYTPLVALDCAGMASLRVVECFNAFNVQSVNLNGCVNALRVCFEAASLNVLDTRTLSSLEDIRCAIQSGGELEVLRAPNDWAHLWHLCVRDQTVLGIDDVFSGGLVLPAMRELYVWGDDNRPFRALAPNIPNPTCSEIQAYVSQVSVLDLENVRWDPGGNGILWMRNSPLQAVNLSTHAAPVRNIDLQWCGMPQAQVDGVLVQMNAFGTSNGILNLVGNAAPSGAGLAARADLLSRNWSVEVAT